MVQTVRWTVCMDLSISAGMWIANVSTTVSTIRALHSRGLVVNRFAGTRLEDLQGEIPALCKDQHGCRYLQKKLEEGVAEHRDMIFRETFGHFADLMTGELKKTSFAGSTLTDIVFKIHLATICAKNCWNIQRTSSAMLSASLLPRTLSTSRSTCTAPGPSKRWLTSCQLGDRQVLSPSQFIFHTYRVRI